MLTVGAVHPFVLLCHPSSPDVWFLWRSSFVRGDSLGPEKNVLVGERAEIEQQ